MHGETVKSQEIYLLLDFHSLSYPPFTNLTLIKKFHQMRNFSTW